MVPWLLTACLTSGSALPGVLWLAVWLGAGKVGWGRTYGEVGLSSGFVTFYGRDVTLRRQVTGRTKGQLGRTVHGGVRSVGMLSQVTSRLLSAVSKLSNTKRQACVGCVGCLKAFGPRTTGRAGSTCRSVVKCGVRMTCTTTQLTGRLRGKRMSRTNGSCFRRRLSAIKQGNFS